MENTFINSQMIPGRRYAQRFETLTEEACYQEGLDRQLNEFAKTHIVVSLNPYTQGPNVNVIVGYLADLTQERITLMCNDFLLKMDKITDWRQLDEEFIQFKTWCEDLVCWEDKNGFTDKPIVVGRSGNSFMPPLLAVLVAAKDKEKVELYKKLFPDFAKKVHEAKVSYFANKEAYTTIVTDLTESD